jgi:hypothetical protein
MNDSDDKIIWRSDLRANTKVCSDTIRRWLKSGRLPKPDVELSRRTLGWKVSTLRAAGIDLV